MSNLPKDWEADIRHKINEHEFSYDPVAWGKMSTLLDQPLATLPDTGTVSASTTIGTVQLWNILVIAAISLLTLATIFWYKHKNAPAPVLESWSVVTPPTEPKAALPATPQNQTTATDRQPTRTVIATTNLREEPLKTLPSPPEVHPNRRPVPKKIGLLKMIPLPDTLTSTIVAPAFQLPEIQLPPRKRNRRTLFPDVIEKY